MSNHQSTICKYFPPIITKIPCNRNLPRWVSQRKQIPSAALLFQMYRECTTGALREQVHSHVTGLLLFLLPNPDHDLASKELSPTQQKT